MLEQILVGNLDVLVNFSASDLHKSLFATELERVSILNMWSEIIGPSGSVFFVFPSA